MEALCWGVLLFLFCFSFKHSPRCLSPGSCAFSDREDSGIDADPGLTFSSGLCFTVPVLYEAFLVGEIQQQRTELNGPQDPLISYMYMGGGI